jgi:hypothetical protein
MLKSRLQSRVAVPTDAVQFGRPLQSPCDCTVCLSLGKFRRFTNPYAKSASYEGGQ